MGSVNIAGVESVSSLPIVSNARQKELLEHVRKGDTVARETLINGSLRLVVSAVARYFGDKENLDDLFQTGCVGLIKAVDGYDAQYQASFSNYATEMIIGEIRNYLRRDHYLHISRLLRRTAYRALKAEEKLIPIYQRVPTASEIATEINESEEEVLLALGICRDPISLYQDYEDTLFLDVIEDPKLDNERWISYLILESGLAHLTPREQLVIQKRFFFDRTQVETANELCMSQAQVSKDEKRALQKLRVLLK